jgi:hypothetical protein
MRVEGAVAGSVHLPQIDGRLLPGCSVVSVTVLDGDLELRAHLVRTPLPRPVREGGWAVADTSPPTTRTPGGPGGARTAAVSRADGLTAAVVGLHGWQHASTHAELDTNAMGPYSAVPVLTATADGPATVLVSLHALTRTAPADPAGLATAVRVEVDGTVLHVHWRTGPHHTLDLATFVPTTT